MFSLRFAGAAASIRGSPKLARTVVHTHRRIGFAKRVLFIPTSFVMTNLPQRKGPQSAPQLHRHFDVHRGAALSLNDF
jgi:hypothetical protein